MLSALLVFGFAPVAKADVAGLTPCSESARFQQRAAAASTPQAKARFEMYSQASCGEDGLPHLIVDGRWSHAGDFVYPGIMFLYVAGCIGWAGREYLKATRGKNAANYEIFIDRSIAIKSLLAAATWPVAAFGEFTSGKLLEDDSKVTVSPRCSKNFNHCPLTNEQVSDRSSSGCSHLVHRHRRNPDRVEPLFPRSSLPPNVNHGVIFKIQREPSGSFFVLDRWETPALELAQLHQRLHLLQR